MKKFHEIRCGEFFAVANEMFLRVAHMNFIGTKVEVNCVNLSNGEPSFAQSDLDVAKVSDKDLKIILQRYAISSIMLAKHGF